MLSGREGDENGSLRSKRFQSSYCAKVRAEAKKKLKSEGVPLPLPLLRHSFFFLLLSKLSRRTSRGNACYAGYENGEKTTIGLISKKAALHMQGTFFVHFFAVVLHDYNVKLPETS